MDGDRDVRLHDEHQPIVAVGLRIGKETADALGAFDERPVNHAQQQVPVQATSVDTGHERT
jgi:hypothetical protein